jgi:hypothetical protein
LEISLADGRSVGVPLEFYPTLLRANRRERQDWVYFPYATAISWETLDLQLSVESILAGRREHVPPPGFRERMEADLARLGLTNKPAAARRRRD